VSAAECTWAQHHLLIVTVQEGLRAQNYSRLALLQPRKNLLMCSLAGSLLLCHHCRLVWECTRQRQVVDTSCLLTCVYARPLKVRSWMSSA
jgi:hypothetical protein